MKNILSRKYREPDAVARHGYHDTLSFMPFRLETYFYIIYGKEYKYIMDIC